MYQLMSSALACLLIYAYVWDYIWVTLEKQLFIWIRSFCVNVFIKKGKIHNIWSPLTTNLRPSHCATWLLPPLMYFVFIISLNVVDIDLLTNVLSIHDICNKCNYYPDRKAIRSTEWLSGLLPTFIITLAW